MSENADRAVIDIETSVIPGVGDYLGNVQAPSNYKNQEAIDKYIAKAKQDEEQRAALDPDLLRIVAIGWQDVDDGSEPVCLIAENEGTERQILTKFWDSMRTFRGPKQLIGFNINDFDVPALMRRSLYLGVKNTIRYDVSRYRHDNIVDLMQLLSYDGKLKYRGLDFYCRRFGIEEPDPIRNNEVPERIVKGDYESVRQHCLADLRKEYRLAEALGVI